MLKNKLNQEGFSLVILIILLVFVVLIVVIGVRAFTAQDKTSASVQWAYDEQRQSWYAKSGVPPNCRTPFLFDQSPIAPALITGVLLPGTYRGNDYKPHGGFSTPESLQGKVEVKLPIDATLVGLTRYYEGDPPDLQYLLTFETSCGIAFRFDHLYTLSPELATIAKDTPEPKLNDTRTSSDQGPPRTLFKSGQVIATRVGLPSLKIYGFDFGVYDYRQPNEISQNTAWTKIHNKHQSLEWYGVCWYDMFPDVSADTLRSLSLQQVDTRRTVKKVSDYCSHTPYKTLDVNNGLPTEY